MRGEDTEAKSLEFLVPGHLAKPGGGADYPRSLAAEGRACLGSRGAMVWLGEREEGKKIGLEVRSWKVMSACVLCLGFRVSGFDLKVVRIVEGFERRLQCLERH